MIILSLSVFASWDRIDGLQLNRAVTDQYGLFNNQVNQDSKIVNTSNQILVSDLDNDGTSEILVTSTDTLYIYNIDSEDELELITSYQLTGSTSSITPAVFPDDDGDSLNEIVGVWDDFFYVFEYNGSQLYNKISIKNKHDLERIPETSMFCDTEQEYSDRIVCFIPAQGGYMQEVTVDVPFEFAVWDANDEPESDDVYSDSELLAGDQSGAGISTNILIRGHTVGAIEEIRLDVYLSQNGVENVSLIYDIFICPVDENSYTAGDIYDNCLETPTLLYNNINLSEALGAGPGVKNITLQNSYFLETNQNYSLTFQYVSGATDNGKNERWFLNADYNPSSNLMRRYLDPSPTPILYSTIPAMTLIGLTSTGHTDIDVCPASASCLSTWVRQAPILIQDTTDGNYKLAFIHDNDNDNDEGIAVLDLNTSTLDTAFNPVGYIDSIFGGDVMYGILPLDVDGSSEDIIFHFESGDLTYMGGVDLQGNTVLASKLFGTDCGGGGGSVGSLPFVLGEDPTVCAVTYCDNSGSSYSEVKCYDTDDSSFVIDYQNTPSSTAEDEFIDSARTVIYSARMMVKNDTYGSQYQMVMPGGIYFLNESGKRPQAKIATGDNDNVNIVTVADANDDGFLDILMVDDAGITGNKIQFFSSFETNQNAVLNDSYAFGGYGSEYGVLDPVVCLNSDIEFFADENITYNNDLGGDLERLVTNCGYDWNHTPTADFDNYLKYGAYDLNKPSIECRYNQTGTYRVYILIQDEANSNDLTEFNTDYIEVRVVNGTQNVDCNLIADFADSGSVTSDVNASAKDTGQPCRRNNECRSGHCDYGYCTLGVGHAYCTSDIQCLSGECVDNACTNAGLWSNIEHATETQYGEDSNSLTFVSLFISIGLALFFVIMGFLSGHLLMGLGGGVVFGFISITFFTLMGWLNPFIFFAMLFAILFLGILFAFLFRGGE